MDIAHLQGSETVASLVSFLDGLPFKEGYRRFKIRTVQGSFRANCSQYPHGRGAQLTSREGSDSMSKNCRISAVGVTRPHGNIASRAFDVRP